MPPIAPLPAPKVFKPKSDLPRLQSYRECPPPSFWEAFPKNHAEPAVSLVDPIKLESLALATRFPNKSVLDEVLLDLKFGAKIGCEGHARSPSRATNAPSAFQNGYRVTDAIASWVSKGFAYGPVDPQDIPANAKVNGIMTREKPDGSVRIILNLSAPKGVSVNDGIDSAKFPTKMSSTRQWLEVLQLTGRNSQFCKTDWSEAYKHLAVCRPDTQLQWFEWLGKAFKELALVFGGASSAGLYDRLAKIVLHIVIKRANFRADWLIQHLDDVCAAAPAGSRALELFDQEYINTAQELGVRLASRSDPEKSFGPSTHGTVLGVTYDTVDWTWQLPPAKLGLLLHNIQELLEADSIAISKLWTVVGKILHIHALLLDGRFHLYHLLVANATSTDPDFCLELQPELKSQLWFWLTILRTCNNRAAIPPPFLVVPPWAVDVYTDAAGGSPTTPGLGCGAVCATFWLYVPWSRAINSGKPAGNGRSLDRCLSALELVGPLAALCASPETFRRGAARFWVDNAGSVFIWKKGYSTSCALSTTLVLALHTVATGLGCQVDLIKITRCSTAWAEMPDALSKAHFRRFWDLARRECLDLPPDPARVPTELLRWLQSPRPDWDLGSRLLRGLGALGEDVLSLL